MDASGWAIAPVIQSLLVWGWQALCITVPGTSITFASVLLGTVAIYVSINLVYMVFGFGDGDSRFFPDSSVGCGRGESGRDHPRTHLK